MPELLKVLGLILFSAFKFFLAPTATVLAGYGFWETVLICCTGGIVGFIFFFKCGEWIQRFYERRFKVKERKKFSRRNKVIVKVKRKYGLWGLAFLTPCLFGIPIGAIIASAYYRNQPSAFYYFFGAIIFWAASLTYVSIYIKTG